MNSKGWFNLEAAAGTMPETQFFEGDSAFKFLGLTRTQRLYGFVGCLVIGFVLSLLGSILLFVGLTGSFAVLYALGTVISLVGTGFLLGFGRQLKMMFKPVRVLATIVFLGSIVLVFIGAFVIGSDVLCINILTRWHRALAGPSRAPRLTSHLTPRPSHLFMLDHCSISHKGGIVLWSRSFTPTASQAASSASSPVNSLIREALIEGRNAENKYEKDGYAVKWTFVNDLELIFVVAYQRILQLTYVDELLAAMKKLFVQYFGPFLTAFVASLHAVSGAKVASSGVGEVATTWDFAKAFEKWDALFDDLLRTLESKAAQDRKSRLKHVSYEPADITPPSDDASTIPSQSGATTVDEEQIARNVQALKNRLRGRGGRGGRRGPGRGDGGSGRDSLPTSDSDTPTKRKHKPAKAQRKWGDEAPTESDMASLDFSSKKSSDGEFRGDLSSLVDQSSLGVRTQDGLYEVKDWEFGSSAETNDAVARALRDSSSSAAQQDSLGTLGSLFARLTGGKILTEQDLRPVLEGMKQHLMKKNVAKEIAEKVCEGVGESLVGKKVSGFQTINAAVRQALSTSLTRILTPKTSTDLLLSIRTKLSSPLPSSQQRQPYSITFVGVNGVGKSTNLSKVCFWLIQNGLRVLIAACDTFRSGAVEQLRVHVRNLSMLGVNGATGSKGRVELFEKGYGKDAAGIAKEAISYGEWRLLARNADLSIYRVCLLSILHVSETARDHDFDVVLIDTAGRMQDNEPLMRALAKLVSTNNPDKILFVGEEERARALVYIPSRPRPESAEALEETTSNLGAARYGKVDGRHGLVIWCVAENFIQKHLGQQLTNRLASVTRYMSAYRRSLFIETYLQQWDDKKYANLVTFIFIKLRQAYKIIKEDVPLLESTMRVHPISRADLDQWGKEQLEYFAEIDNPEDYDHIRDRKLNKAWGKVRGLIIKRLFELHKINCAQTGRPSAVQSIITISSLTACAVPPRKPLDWEVISKYGFIEEFDLLREMRDSVRDKPWTKVLIRESIDD
ncbi:hypothetical protein NM688_g1770 [Phlebia brevispora]|uniref:Uncharacterized protein n=1 Tax=Phlebia brevispora TaxID=194682 RepID=A0ACC1TAD3_9APHY|nr:hypothetical protein NM688_g1770 [Phlebia brevispora]